MTLAASAYALRLALGGDLPVNDGFFRVIEVIAPEGSVVNPRPPAAVGAGNVETSQRIVDVALGALARALPRRIPAASAGTMNNHIANFFGCIAKGFFGSSTIFISLIKGFSIFKSV